MNKVLDWLLAAVGAVALLLSSTPHATPPVAPPPVAAQAAAPAPEAAPEVAEPEVEPDSPEAATAPRLAQIPIPHPPVVTGLPYPGSCKAVGKLPDPKCTPGSVDPAVTQATISTTICRAGGYTKTVRPPASNTDPVKTSSMKAYGEAPGTRGTTELDHLVPLALGGSDDVSNLWPEPSDEPGHGVNNSKDALELALNKAVCSHKIPLDAAQNAVAADWTTAKARLGLN